MDSELIVLADLLFDGHEVKTGAARIEIDSGHIKAVVPGAGDTHRGVPVLDARGSLVIPGLINAHTHTARGGMFDPNETISVNTITQKLP